MCVRIYAHTHTNTAREVLGCEPRVRKKTLGEPKKSRLTKSRHMNILIRIQSTHVYVYAGRRGKILI